MPKYIVEREMPGIGQTPKEALQEAGQKSKSVLKELGPDIQWVESYLTDDKLYCVYIAPSEELIRKHAAKVGMPASKISQVRMVIDPSMTE